MVIFKCFEYMYLAQGWAHEMPPATQRGVCVGGDARNPFQCAVTDTIAFKILADGPHLRSLEQIQSWLVLVVLPDFRQLSGTLFLISQFSSPIFILRSGTN